MSRPGGSNKPSASGSGLLSAARRMLGFLVLAGAGLTLLAAVILLPAYAETARMQYQRDCLRAVNADMEALREARERFCKALEAGTDPVLTERLAAMQLAYRPADRLTDGDGDREARFAADLVNVPPRPRPAAPSGLLHALAARAAKGGTRRGLLLLALAAIGAAMFLFPVPDRSGGKGAWGAPSARHRHAGAQR